MTRDASNIDNERLASVVSTIQSAAYRYAARFGIEQLREEIHAEAVARVVTLIDQARPPFDASPDAEGAIDHMQRFTHGLVANVAREALRGRLRHAHLPLEDRAATCAALKPATRTPHQALEVEESIDGALAKFRSLAQDIRETIVAEEIIQNEYASDDADRLCRSCEVSFQRVWKMIENRKSGHWTAEAWRQRVHRSRKKARAAVGAMATFTLAVALAVGTLALQTTNAQDISPTAPNPTIAGDDGSTQNGKKQPAPAIRVASTQNGSKGTSMGGDATPA